jgi:hypothetical protein
MKRIITTIVVAFIITQVSAQDVKRTFGVGLQSSFPTYGLSVKYGITEQSVVQATIAPFGASADGGSVSLNFYGARYIHRFPGDDASKVVLDPYLYAGGGLMSYTVNTTAYGGSKSTSNSFGYSVGGGLEAILIGKLGVSAEVGYGKMNFSGGVAVNALLFGGGLHFYIN